jgi:hypothetical protein
MQFFFWDLHSETISFVVNLYLNRQADLLLIRSGGSPPASKCGGYFFSSQQLTNEFVN